MAEKWKRIKGYPGYRISNRGRVKSIQRVVKFIKNGKPTSRIIPECMRSLVVVKGYHHVELWRKNESTKSWVHKLVADAFIPNPLNLPFVLHADDNPINNRVKNLRWGTHLDNMKDRNDRNRQYKGSTHHKAVLSEKDIPRIRKLLDRGRSARSLGREYGVYHSTILKIAHNKNWKHVE